MGKVGTGSSFQHHPRGVLDVPGLAGWMAGPAWSDPDHLAHETFLARDLVGRPSETALPGPLHVHAGDDAFAVLKDSLPEAGLVVGQAIVAYNLSAHGGTYERLVSIARGEPQAP